MATARFTKKDTATYDNTPFPKWLRYFHEELDRRGLPHPSEQEAFDAYEVGQSPWTEAGEVEARLCMAEVTGPISSLPGSCHGLPDGTMCDEHEDRPAVARVQGATDSMGCEMYDFCQECLDKYRADTRKWREEPCRCDWCFKETTDCRETRDYEEGMTGPVYMVCAACRKRRDDIAEMEMGTYWD